VASDYDQCLYHNLSQQPLRLMPATKNDNTEGIVILFMVILKLDLIVMIFFKQ
jgi:hypothetical protein